MKLIKNEADYIIEDIKENDGPQNIQVICIFKKWANKMTYRYYPFLIEDTGGPGRSGRDLLGQDAHSGTSGPWVSRPVSFNCLIAQTLYRVYSWKYLSRRFN